MEIVRSLDEQFARLHERSQALVQAVPTDKLYWQPPRERARTFPVYSCGEHILRSAAAVEQTFGGLFGPETSPPKGTRRCVSGDPPPWAR